jgi:hypothetical protein
MLDYHLYNTSFPSLSLARFEARAHDPD